MNRSIKSYLLRTDLIRKCPILDYGCMSCLYIIHSNSNVLFCFVLILFTLLFSFKAFNV